MSAPPGGEGGLTLSELARAASARGVPTELVDPDGSRDPAGWEGEGGDARPVTLVQATDQVVAGALFGCVVGSRTDGHDLAGQAVAAGAIGLVCERLVGAGVPELRVGSVRAALGPLAAALWGDPSADLDVVGVTGTNGKTTVVHLLESILDVDGRRPAMIGTLTGARTTPEAPDLQAQLAGLRAAGNRSVAMEVSSHALAQHRVDGTSFSVAVFTNLSQDHLDYHGTMEDYFAAKALLFRPELSAQAVFNRDDPYGVTLAEQATVPATSFGLDDAADVRFDPGGTRFRWRGREIDLSLVGRHNLSNALAAATVGGVLGIDEATIARGLSSVSPVRGRFEVVHGGQDFLVAVDYAHTPDALARVLGTCRELAGAGGHGTAGGRPGRVIVVFGCGGDRDTTKRPQMGATAAAAADEVVVTSDNPRSEDPSAIMADVMNGIPRDTGAIVRQEGDRARAIADAVTAAGAGDVVLIAGKGHETLQVTGERSEPFDDRLVARRALEVLAR